MLTGLLCLHKTNTIQIFVRLIIQTRIELMMSINHNTNDLMSTNYNTNDLMSTNHNTNDLMFKTAVFNDEHSYCFYCKYNCFLINLA